jgi:hypothetical protein
MTSPTSVIAKTSKPSVNRCLDCDYPLRDLSENRCPECGRRFDPSDDQTTSTTGGPFPRWARLLASPIGWPMYLLALAPVAASFWELRRPGGHFDALASGASLWLLVGAVSLVRLVARTSVIAYFERPPTSVRGHWTRWLVVPAMFVAWLVLGEREWPQRLAFYWSRPALETLARRALDDPSLGSVPLPARAGLLTVSRIERIPQGVRLYTGPGYDAVPCGYAYCPAGRPPDGEDHHYYAWSGDWWQYWGPRSGPPPATPTTAPATAPTESQVGPIGDGAPSSRSARPRVGRPIPSDRS